MVGENLIELKNYIAPDSLIRVKIILTMREAHYGIYKAKDLRV